jgi:phenylalanine-4-hydroxylase
MNPKIASRVPNHLKPFLSRQRYENYTPVQHAVWRYVMRQNWHFFKDHAHEAYKEGLRKSGIVIDRIPRIEEMDECLKPFGWGAVPIDGLIPGVVFFDFQAHGLLPIATDIRTLEHIAYTPAPDIIHEAGGHAPILCDEKYAEYVKTFGRIGAKALSTREEHEVFLATRRLSQLMEDPASTPEKIRVAERELEEKMSLATEVSEATEISRLYWWTVEYGLIGDLEQPRIYGAGLLSSIKEGQECLDPSVKKIPFDLDTVIRTDYDVTRPQPQLFVCRDFDQLIEAVEQYADRMAFRTGGTDGLRKAVRSGQTATAVYSSGLQVSGVFDRLLSDEQGKAIYLHTAGPTALAFAGEELPGHGKDVHRDGFGSPIGKLKHHYKPLEDWTPEDFNKHGIVPEHEVHLEFESGVTVRGILKNVTFKNARPLLLRFVGCTVLFQNEPLFLPEQGIYDMAVGERVVSVFAGAADPERFFADAAPFFEDKLVSAPGWTELDRLYQWVRDMREHRKPFTSAPQILEELNRIAPDDWLLRLELLELAAAHPATELIRLRPRLEAELKELEQSKPQLQSLIRNGLRLLELD